MASRSCRVTKPNVRSGAARELMDDAKLIRPKRKSPDVPDDAKNEVIKSIEESYEMYSKLNDGRNPLLGFET